jgi:hypothetical protein
LRPSAVGSPGYGSTGLNFLNEYFAARPHGAMGPASKNTRPGASGTAKWTIWRNNRPPAASGRVDWLRDAYSALSMVVEQIGGARRHTAIAAATRNLSTKVASTFSIDTSNHARITVDAALFVSAV